MIRFNVELQRPEDQQAAVTITMSCKYWRQLYEMLHKAEVEKKQPFEPPYDDPSTKPVREIHPVSEFLRGIFYMLQKAEETIQHVHEFEVDP